MSFRKRLRRVGRVALAGATLGGSEIVKNKKKIGSAIKKNPELVGAGIGLAFGAPIIGAGIGQAFGQARSSGFDPSSVGSQLGGFNMPEQLGEGSAVSEGSPAPAEAGFAPGFDKKWLIIGAVAIVAIVLLMKSSKT